MQIFCVISLLNLFIPIYIIKNPGNQVPGQPMKQTFRKNRPPFPGVACSTQINQPRGLSSRNEKSKTNYKTTK